MNEREIKNIHDVLTDKKKDRLLHLVEKIKKKIIGQDHVLDKVITTLERGELDFNVDNRRPHPKGSFLFLQCSLKLAFVLAKV